MKGRVATIAVFGALALTGCGDDEESDSTTAVSEESTTAAAAAHKAGGIPQISGRKPVPDVSEGSVQQALPESVNELRLQKVGELPALLDAGALDAVVASYARYDEAGVVVLEGVRHELAVFSSAEDAEAWREEVVEYVTKSGVPDAGYRVGGEEPVTSSEGSQVGTVTLLTRAPRDRTLLWTNGSVYGAIDGFFVDEDLVVGVYEKLPY